jgi:hypothetical protein
MAIWRTWKRADGSQGLLYRNLVTRAEHRCGVMTASTSQNIIVEWILNRGDASSWDLISFDTGSVFLVMPPGARA